MRRWIERVCTAVLLTATLGLLLACWAPAYVGAPASELRWHRRNPPPAPVKAPPPPNRKV